MSETRLFAAEALLPEGWAADVLFEIDAEGSLSAATPGAAAGDAPRAAGPACPGCGTTAGEFKVSGRLGCARCYETFKGALLPVLERVHDATSHRGRMPGPVAPRTDDNRASKLRRLLAEAIDAERYEEAANLRDKLQELETRGEEA